ncbi:MAG: AI-2E family transporter [Oscillospiraceae bacterium]|nr:AI-2E family transporter [Oscillospiraceae bacterium]
MKETMKQAMQGIRDTKDLKYLKTFLTVGALIILAKIVFDFDAFRGTFDFFLGLIQPFLFGFIAAYCINIPVTWLEKAIGKFADKRAAENEKLKAMLNAKSKSKSKSNIKKADALVAKPTLLHKLARPISIVVTLALLGGLIAFGLMTIVPMLYSNVRQLIEEIPGYVEAGIAAIHTIPLIEELGIEEMIANLSIEDIWEYVPTMDLAGMAAGLFSGVFTAFLTIVSTLYFLAEYSKVKDFVKRLIRAHSPKRQKPVLKYIRLIDFSFRKFISCQFIDSLVLATITMIAFTIQGSPYAVTLALMLGVLNVIPYFGSIVGTAVAVFIIWATDGFHMALIMAIVLFAIQQFDGNYINPKIMGTSFKISPVLVIIAITVGGSIGGVLGMIFAIPVANVLKNVLEEYIQSKEALRKSLGEDAQGETGGTLSEENKGDATA